MVQSRRSVDIAFMSAYPPIADMTTRAANCSDVPRIDIDGAVIPSDKTETPRRRKRPILRRYWNVMAARMRLNPFVRRPEGEGPGAAPGTAIFVP